MRDIKSVAIVVPAHSTSSCLRQIIEHSITLGRWLKCELHFLCSIDELQEVENTITGLKRSSSNGLSTIVVHLPEPESADSILDLIQKYSCSLVFLQINTRLGAPENSWALRLLELSPVPILLLPEEVGFRSAQFPSLLVLLSGEERSSAALELSLKLAEQADSHVDILHVVAKDQQCPCDSSVEALGDQLHHEYRALMEKVGAEASPYSSPEERARIRHFHHSEGFTTEEVLRVLKQYESAILVLEWKGTLAEGHASTIKEILLKTPSPLLFTKVRQEPKSILRVGKYLSAGQSNSEPR